MLGSFVMKMLMPAMVLMTIFVGEFANSMSYAG
jgi:hypothetical protein